MFILIYIHTYELVHISFQRLNNIKNDQALEISSDLSQQNDTYQLPTSLAFQGVNTRFGNLNSLQNDLYSDDSETLILESEGKILPVEKVSWLPRGIQVC